MAAATVLKSAGAEGADAWSVRPAVVEEVLQRLLNPSSVTDPVLTIVPDSLYTAINGYRIQRQFDALKSKTTPLLVTSSSRNKANGKAKSKAKSAQGSVNLQNLSRAEIAKIIKDTVSTLADNPDIGEEVSWGEGGLDSLGEIELCSRLSSAFGVAIQPIVIFQCPNVRELSAQLHETFAAQASPQNEAEEESVVVSPWFSSYLCKQQRPR
jgi:acyl carrier protein